ncbi:MAG TPA: glycosyltransferase family 39 protein [Pseudorhodoplanes sp.]|nr:glycosyltransferase family 39 protein [Pseudorhodoplanes sp.]
MEHSAQTAILRRLGVAGLWLAIVAALVAIYSIRIGFPVYWHPDEPTKVPQIMSGGYNFNHPQLLLRLTAISKWLLGGADIPHDVALAGRAVSMICSALAAAAFGLLLARPFGIAFGIAAALLIGLSPLVYENAHYFKEDATLLFAISLVLLALQIAEEKFSMAHLGLLGAAAGLAIAAKYIGVLMVLPVVTLLVVKRASPLQWAIVIGSLLAVVLAVNYPALNRLDEVATAFTREWGRVTAGQGPAIRDFRSPKILLTLWNTLPAIAIALWIVCLAVRLRRLPGTVTAWAIAFMPLVFLVALQMSVIKVDRYALPAAAMMLAAAVWVCAEISRDLRPRQAAAFLGICLVIASVSSARLFKETFDGYVDDNRLRMIQWIRDKLPSDAVIAADQLAGLPDPDNFAFDPSIPPLPQKVIRQGAFLGDTATIESLRAAGVTHVVVRMPAEFDFRQERPTLRQKFYLRLYADAKPVRIYIANGPVRRPAPVNLRLYDIRM